jgi:hypothetical protein
VLNSVLLWSPYGLRDRRLALVALRPGRFFCVLSISIDLFFCRHDIPLSDFRLQIFDLPREIGKAAISWGELLTYNFTLLTYMFDVYHTYNRVVRQVKY